MKIKILDQWTSVDEVFANCFNGIDSLGMNGFDVAVYMGDKMSVWPCGDIVDIENGIRGTEWCGCNKCQAVRDIIYPES